MAEPIQILTVKKDHGDGLIVDFTDGTTAGYVAEELLKLRPHREPAQGLTGRRRSRLPANPPRVSLVRCGKESG